jgi:hypothetical protein
MGNIRQKDSLQSHRGSLQSHRGWKGVCALCSVTLSVVACATEPATATEGAAIRGATSLSPPGPGDSVPRAVERPLVAPALSGQVGFYDLFFGSGQAYQVPPILAAGGTAIAVDDPSAAELANLNVLWAHNPDNGLYGGEYLSRLADIDAAVQNGMVLVLHDRLVAGAAGILPGASGFTIVRDFTEGADINIRDASTQVTVGLNDTSLDGGNSSSHGFALDSSLPANAKLILTATTPSHIVTFCYPRGKGAVIYSSIPLDFYLAGGGTNPPRDAFNNTYAPNVVQYAIAGACKAKSSGPRPTPNVVQ